MSKSLKPARRINYWTTASLEPDIEAISKEVFDLARHFENSKIFGVSPHIRLRLGNKPLHMGCHPILDPLLRLAIPLMERTGDLNHVYAEITPWIYFKTLLRKPTILTIASERGQVNERFLDRVDAIVVQTEQMRMRLSSYGRWDDKIEVIYPGVDLAMFRPGEGNKVAGSKTRVVFATFPRSAEELGPRGVNLLIELASVAPDVEFLIVGRPWATGDTASEVVRSQIRGLQNVRFLEGGQARMDELYRQSDFIIIPYTTSDGGKECPLSLVEGLAAGLPALVTRVAPISTFVEAEECGLSFDTNGLSFNEVLTRARAQYGLLREKAIAAAARHFNKAVVLHKYSCLYEKVFAARA